MKKYAEILRQVRKDVAQQPTALLDYLDALMLAANDRAEDASVPGERGTWLGIANRLNQVMREFHPHIPR